LRYGTPPLTDVVPPSDVTNPDRQGWNPRKRVEGRHAPDGPLWRWHAAEPPWDASGQDKEDTVGFGCKAPVVNHTTKGRERSLSSLDSEPSSRYSPSGGCAA
jgi:hypothetical protein